MKRTIVILTAALMLLSSFAMAQDPKPADKLAVTVPGEKLAVPSTDADADAAAIADAEKAIDDSIKKVDEDPGAVIKELIQLAKEGRWGPFVGLALMFLIWIFRKFIWKLIPKKALLWVTLGVGMLSACVTELSLGVTWWKALLDAFLTVGIVAVPMIYKRYIAPTEEEKPA